eukprot:12598350-Alexandrium_andersonii.AAC.1
MAQRWPPEPGAQFGHQQCSRPPSQVCRLAGRCGKRSRLPDLGFLLQHRSLVGPSIQGARALGRWPKTAEGSRWRRA